MRIYCKRFNKGSAGTVEGDIDEKTMCTMALTKSSVQRRIESRAEADRSCGPDGFHCAASGRNGYGERAARPRDSQPQFAREASFRQTQLRGDSLRVIGKRVVRP